MSCHCDPLVIWIIPPVISTGGRSLNFDRTNKIPHKLPHIRSGQGSEGQYSDIYSLFACLWYNANLNIIMFRSILEKLTYFFYFLSYYFSPSSNR